MEEVVPQSAKLFSERLSHCLDETEAPTSIRERAVILSKMIDIPKQQAWSLLEGHLLPDQDTLQKIAAEFEVDPQWLSGEK
ncbi:MAG: helix-turn-helix transcriptional regulator [Gammaproteobacteria bacterium]|nr:helix-turn-helix transcriptional regulator [Gammaproteobacteria bacterium]MCW5583444.1 helix-turn-helix transcriptional regulator [Gammaproteobacteria bacterium]